MNSRKIALGIMTLSFILIFSGSVATFILGLQKDREETYHRIYEENKNQKEELAYEASHDQLTGVFNRKGFEDILNHVSHSKVALLLIDIDKFKRINDTYGHTEGDKVLLQMTKVVAKHFRSSDTLCRIGGDEFVMFINGIGEESSVIIEKKIRDIIEQIM